MTMNVTMLEDVPAETGGGIWRRGDTKSASDAYGKSIVERGLATAADLRRVDFVPIASADVSTTTGTLGESREVSDGDNRGAKITWATPEGATAPTWCWWLWPLAAYEGA